MHTFNLIFDSIFSWHLETTRESSPSEISSDEKERPVYDSVNDPMDT